MSNIIMIRAVIIPIQHYRAAKIQQNQFRSVLAIFQVDISHEKKNKNLNIIESSLYASLFYTLRYSECVWISIDDIGRSTTHYFIKPK